MPLADLEGLTLIQVEYYDYLGNPVIGTENVVMRYDTQTSYNITQEESSHSIGHRTNGGQVPALWRLENNNLIVVGGPPPVEGRRIDQCYEFELKSLTANGKEYTKFKFI